MRSDVVERSKLLFSDGALALRLELADARASEAFVDADRRLNPGSDSASKEVAGGSAVFTGLQSPLTQAFALGLRGPVAADELDRLEEFYRTRGSAVFVEMCPLADPSLLQLFNERGYRPIEFTNVLIRPLDRGDSFRSAAADKLADSVPVRQVRPSDLETWASVVARGFVQGEVAEQAGVALFKTLFHTARTTCVLAELDGQVAGGGVVAMCDGIAGLAATSTLAEFRNRGIQTALVRARLSLAVEAGCELAMVTTSPGSTSQRNVERQGFSVVYTRCKFTREWVED